MKTARCRNFSGIAINNAALAKDARDVISVSRAGGHWRVLSGAAFLLNVLQIALGKLI
jgi:hypothetical protein